MREKEREVRLSELLQECSFYLDFVRLAGIWRNEERRG